jgi:hypothetical protein
MSLTCPHGHTQGFEKASDPAQPWDLVVCVQCRTEAVFHFSTCLCGNKQYTFRPSRQDPDNSIYITCLSCGRNYTVATTHLKLLILAGSFLISGAVCFPGGYFLWKQVVPSLGWPEPLALGVLLGAGALVAIPIAVLVTGLIRRVFFRARK